MKTDPESFQVNQHTIRITSANNVMPPSPYSLFLAENIPEARTKTDGLDIGTGSGFLAVALARNGWSRIVGTDINPESIRSAKQTVQMSHDASEFEWEVCDLFPSKATTHFDIIICNPPSLPMPHLPGDDTSSFYYAGPKGRDVLDRLITQAPDYLNHGGVLLFINTSLANTSRTRQMLTDSHFCHEIIASKEIPFRDHYYQHLPWFTHLAERKESEFTLHNGRAFERLDIFRCQRM